MPVCPTAARFPAWLEAPHASFAKEVRALHGIGSGHRGESPLPGDETQVCHAAGKEADDSHVSHPIHAGWGVYSSLDECLSAGEVVINAEPTYPDPEYPFPSCPSTAPSAVSCYGFGCQHDRQRVPMKARDSSSSSIPRPLRRLVAPIALSWTPTCGHGTMPVFGADRSPSRARSSHFPKTLGCWSRAA